LLAAGCSNQEISEALFISVGTVKWHVHHVLEKLEFPAALRQPRKLAAWAWSSSIPYPSTYPSIGDNPILRAV
jgi:orotate phosphoribosyltransferase-like protein